MKKAYHMTEPKEWPSYMGLRHYMPNAMLRLTSPQHALVTIALSLPLPSPSHGHHPHCHCWHCHCTITAAAAAAAIVSTSTTAIVIVVAPTLRALEGLALVCGACTQNPTSKNE